MLEKPIYLPLPNVSSTVLKKVSRRPRQRGMLTNRVDRTGSGVLRALPWQPLCIRVRILHTWDSTHPHHDMGKTQRRKYRKQ